MFGLGLAVANLLLGLGQIGRMPFGTVVDGVQLGMATTDTAKQRLSTLKAEPLLLVGSKEYEINPDKAGISVDAAKVLQKVRHMEAMDYIPMFRLFNAQSYSADWRVDEVKLEEYVRSLPIPARVDASNAKLVILDSGQAAIQPEAPGAVFDANNASKRMAEDIRFGTMRTAISTGMLLPQVKSADLQDELQLANTLLGSSVVLSGQGVTVELGSSMLRPAIKVEVLTDGTSKPVVDMAALSDILAGVSNKWYIAAGLRTVTLQDGIEIASNGGSNGRALAVETTAAQVAEAMAARQTQVAATVNSIPTRVNYIRTYTATSAGLAAMLRDFAESHGGTYRISVQELGGAGRGANYYGSSVMIPASTYKTYVAYVALRKVEQGSLTMNTPTSAGTVGDCINRMIHVSDNACGSALRDVVGGDSVLDSEVLAAGFGHTSFSGWYTSSGDLAGYFTRLNSYALLNTEHTDLLLGLFKNQIYRSGIPAGSRGAPVANKVGHIGGYVHDAGIVYSPKSTYVLSVMTSGGSYAEISQLSGQVHDLLNR